MIELQTRKWNLKQTLYFLAKKSFVSITNVNCENTNTFLYNFQQINSVTSNFVPYTDKFLTSSNDSNENFVDHPFLPSVKTNW